MNVVYVLASPSHYQRVKFVKIGTIAIKLSKALGGFMYSKVHSCVCTFKFFSAPVYGAFKI